MTDFDPTDPWGERSPWENAQPDTNTAPEAPVTTQPATTSPNPFKIGFTLKAATGFEAEWLTPAVYGATAEETAERGKALLLAMRSVGLIDLASQAAEYTRGQYKGGGVKPAATAPASQPSFNPNSGQVQYNQAPQAPFGGGAPAPDAGGVARPANVPAHFTYKEGQKNGKSWKGWFPPRGSDEAPIWG